MAPPALPPLSLLSRTTADASAATSARRQAAAAGIEERDGRVGESVGLGAPQSPWMRACRALSRAYHSAPRVGVGAVLWRVPQAARPEVLLVRRAKPPHLGLWSFPGGAQELGETLAGTAARELGEEVPGAAFCGDRARSGGLARGAVCDAVDSITRDASGEIEYHYTIVEVAGVAAAGSAAAREESPRAASDASAAVWVTLERLEEMEAAGGRVTPGCARVARAALERFGGVLVKGAG